MTTITPCRNRPCTVNRESSKQTLGTGFDNVVTRQDLATQPETCTHVHRHTRVRVRQHTYLYWLETHSTTTKLTSISTTHQVAQQQGCPRSTLLPEKTPNTRLHKTNIFTQHKHIRPGELVQPKHVLTRPLWNTPNIWLNPAISRVMQTVFLYIYLLTPQFVLHVVYVPHPTFWIFLMLDLDAAPSLSSYEVSDSVEGQLGGRLTTHFSQDSITI